LHFELPDAIRYVFEETQSRLICSEKCSGIKLFTIEQFEQIPVT